MRTVKKKASSKTNFLLKNFHWLVWLIIFASTVYFFTENPARGIVILGMLLLWVFAAHRTNPLRASILTFLAALPFNITLALPFLVDPYISGVYVNYLVPVISVLDLFILLIIASHVSRKATFKESFKDIPPLLYLFGGYLIVHTLFHLEVSVLFNSARIFLYSLGILWTVRSFKKEKIFKEALLVLTISIAIQLIIGLLQFSGGRSLGLEFLGESKLLAGAIGTSFIKLSEGEFLRAYGTFPHPNVLAGYSLFSFFIGTASYYLTREKRTSLILMIISSFLLLFTFSRIPISLWAILLLIIVYLSLRGKGLSILLFERFGTFFNGNDYSLEDRIKLAGEALRIIKQNIFTGVGFGNFTRALEGNVPYAASGISLLQPVHNVFLLLISEHGLLPALSIIISATVLKLKTVLAYKGLTKTFLILGFLFLLVVLAFDHYLLTLPQGLSILLISLFL